jgi:hypothetical protein
MEKKNHIKLLDSLCLLSFQYSFQKKFIIGFKVVKVIKHYNKNDIIFNGSYLFEIIKTQFMNINILTPGAPK